MPVVNIDPSPLNNDNNKKVSRHCQLFPSGQKYPATKLRTTELRNQIFWEAFPCSSTRIRIPCTWPHMIPIISFVSLSVSTRLEPLQGKCLVWSISYLLGCVSQCRLGPPSTVAPGIFVKIQSPGSHLRFNKLPR